MDRALGHASRDFKGIEVSLDKIKELLKFVGRTGRFKMTLGDAIGTITTVFTTRQPSRSRPAGLPTNPPSLSLPTLQFVDLQAAESSRQDYIR